MLYEVITVLLGLSGSRAASHTNILDNPTKTCHFVPLEVRQADEHVCIHNGTTDFCFLYVLPSDHWYRYIT